MPNASASCPKRPARCEQGARCTGPPSTSNRFTIGFRDCAAMLLAVCSHLAQAWTAHCVAHSGLLGNLFNLASCMRPLRRMRRITHNSQLRPTRTNDKCARKHSLRRPAALRYAACSQAAAPLHTHTMHTQVRMPREVAGRRHEHIDTYNVTGRHE